MSKKRYFIIERFGSKPQNTFEFDKPISKLQLAIVNHEFSHSLFQELTSHSNPNQFKDFPDNKLKDNLLILITDEIIICLISRKYNKKLSMFKIVNNMRSLMGSKPENLRKT